MSNDFGAIILAAGKGERYGKKKQHEMLKNKEVWRWSFDTIKPLVDNTVVVGIDTPGGNTRQESVKIGLEKIKSKYIIIHDAVRPLVSTEQIEKLKELLLQGEKSISFCISSADTIILDNVTYLERSHLKRLQVPQAFKRDLLYEAHENTNKTNATDDCQIMQEVFGISPFLVEGGTNLHKITFPDDLAIIEALI